MYKASISIIFITLLLFLNTSCSNDPVPINYGADECEHCRMLISDNRYGAETITDKGKAYKFDSIECLIENAVENNLIGDEKHTFYVTDFANPNTFTNVRSTFFAHNDNIRSPMGLNVSAFSSKSDADKFLNDNGGTSKSWLDVIEMVKQNSM